MESTGLMILGEIARKQLHVLTALTAAAMLVAAPQAAFAQEATEAVPTAQAAPDDLGTATEPTTADEAPEAAADFDYFGPDMIKGQPEPGGMTFQAQHNDNGEFALWMHDAILLPLIVAISLFVLGLLLWVMVKYNRRANPVPSKTSHNTLIEVVWTLLPVLILVGIAVPSITLLARQYESPPEDALTIKATGYQWYWGYTYPDNGGFEVISNMLDEDAALAAGEPHQLAVDNRMVVPVGEPIRLQTIGADVIHSFGIPSLWFKMDAVPGRLNEHILQIDEPGIYYGQCMELCGARHGYMPIAIEARSRPDFERWLASKGGKTSAQIAAEEAATAAAATADTAAEDEQSAEDAAEAGDGEGVEAAEEAETAA